MPSNNTNMIVKVPKNGALDIDPPIHPVVPSYYAQPDPGSEGIPWRQILRILRKHWKASLTFALVVELALGLLVFSLPNTYQAQATLEVDPPSSIGSTLSGDASSASPEQQDYLDTQSEILQSDDLALGTIKAMHLDHNPTFLSQTWIQKLTARAAAWIPRKHAKGNQIDNEKLLKIWHDGLSVAQVKDSRLLAVAYESRDAQLSEAVVHTLLQRYLDEAHRSKYEATLKAAQSVAPELNALRQSVDQSNRAMLTFQNSHVGVELGSATPMNPDGTDGVASAANSNPVATQVAELNEQLVQAIGDRLQQESYMKLIAEGKNDALPQMKDNALIQGITAHLVDSRAQLAQALAIYGGNNPKVRELQEQTTELSKQLNAERDRIASQIQATYASAKTREQLIREKLAQMNGPLHQSNADVLRYDALKRQAEANANLYTTLSTEIKQMAISGSLATNNIHITDPALVPQKPYAPHRFRILGIGMVFGLVGGMGLAFIAEGMDDTISTVDDIRRWSRLPALALVPQIGVFRRNGRSLATNGGKRLKRPTLAIQARGLKFLTDTPHSAEAEAIRNLETSVRLSVASGERPVQTVLITSAFPGEGKTTVAVNLAIALARHGKTCLVDADFRRPVITSSFGLSLRPGLKDLLSKRVTMQDVCQPHPEVPNLIVLGIGLRRSDIPEIATSRPMRELLGDLRNNFEYIVLDSPPVIPFSEARWLSTQADQSVLVARCSATTRRALLWSLEILAELDAPVLGVVLNGVDLDAEYYAYGVNDYNSYYAAR
jgi:polysaccharide biosynthesis transport protein